MVMIERINHKNEWCKRIDDLCQEGYCDCCISYIERNIDKSHSIYSYI